jgi:predicted ArsR family transcriptional regulator
VRLANCPFHALLEVSVDLVCGANRAFCSGLVEGLDARPVRAVLDPQPGPECCVRLEASVRLEA